MIIPSSCNWIDENLLVLGRIIKNLSLCVNFKINTWFCDCKLFIHRICRSAQAFGAGAPLFSYSQFLTSHKSTVVSCKIRPILWKESFSSVSYPVHYRFVSFSIWHCTKLFYTLNGTLLTTKSTSWKSNNVYTYALL